VKGLAEKNGKVGIIGKTETSQGGVGRRVPLAVRKRGMDGKV
jgi:hypothetical protein